MTEPRSLIDFTSPRGTAVSRSAEARSSREDASPVSTNPFDQLASLAEASMSTQPNTLVPGGRPASLAHASSLALSDGPLDRAYLTSGSVSVSSQETELDDSVFLLNEKKWNEKSGSDYPDLIALIEEYDEDLMSIPPPPLYEETAELDKYDEMGLPVLQVACSPAAPSRAERPPSPMAPAHATALPEESEALKRYKMRKRASLDNRQSLEWDNGEQGSIRRANSDSYLAGGEGAARDGCSEETIVLSQRVPVVVAADAAAIRLKQKLQLEGLKKPGPLKAVVPVRQMVHSKGGTTNDANSLNGSTLNKRSPSPYSVDHPGNRLNTTSNLRKDVSLNMSGPGPVASSTPNRLPFAFLRSKSDTRILKQQVSAGTPKRSSRDDSRSSSGSSKRSSSAGGAPSPLAPPPPRPAPALKLQGAIKKPTTGVPRSSLMGSKLAPLRPVSQRPQSVPTTRSEPLRTLNQVGTTGRPAPKKIPAQGVPKVKRLHSLRKENVI